MKPSRTTRQAATMKRIAPLWDGKLPSVVSLFLVNELIIGTP
jgi:hypothetical protein